jgi:hypothetical protein
LNEQLAVDPLRLERAGLRKAALLGIRATFTAHGVRLQREDWRLRVPYSWIQQCLAVHGLTVEESALAMGYAAAQRFNALDSVAHALPTGSVGDDLMWRRADGSWPLLTAWDRCGPQDIAGAVASGSAGWPCGCQPRLAARLVMRGGTLRQRLMWNCRHWQRSHRARGSAQDWLAARRPQAWCRPLAVRSFWLGDSTIVLLFAPDAGSLAVYPAVLRAVPEVQALSAYPGGQLMALPLRRDLLAVCSPKHPAGLAHLAADGLRRELGPDRGWLGPPLGGAIPFAVTGPAVLPVGLVRV